MEANVLKGIGTTGKAVGKFIDSIPVVKEAMVDEFLQENSLKLKRFVLMRSRYTLLQIETKSLKNRNNLEVQYRCPKIIRRRLL